MWDDGTCRGRGVGRCQAAGRDVGRQTCRSASGDKPSGPKMTAPRPTAPKMTASRSKMTASAAPQPPAVDQARVACGLELRENANSAVRRLTAVIQLSTDGEKPSEHWSGGSERKERGRDTGEEARSAGRADILFICDFVVRAGFAVVRISMQTKPRRCVFSKALGKQ